MTTDLQGQKTDHPLAKLAYEVYTSFSQCTVPEPYINLSETNKRAWEIAVLQVLNFKMENDIVKRREEAKERGYFTIYAQPIQIPVDKDGFMDLEKLNFEALIRHGHDISHILNSIHDYISECDYKNKKRLIEQLNSIYDVMSAFRHRWGL